MRAGLFVRTSERCGWQKESWHGWHGGAGTGECEDYLTAVRGTSGAAHEALRNKRNAFVSLGCNKAVSDHRALSPGRA